MAFDTLNCPQNEDEARSWFYEGIGKNLGASADGWETVMSNCGLPPGYGPNVVPTASMPFFAFTQQFSGGPKGRIFLPTDTPDELGYYTRCIQYLDDAPGTYSAKANPKEQFSAKSTGLVWAWYWVAGNEYVPVVGTDSSQPIPGNGITREEVYAILADYFKVDDKIALESASGKVICAEGGGPVNSNEEYTFTSRSNVGPWESYRILRGQ